MLMGRGPKTRRPKRKIGFYDSITTSLPIRSIPGAVRPMAVAMVTQVQSISVLATLKAAWIITLAD